MDVPGSGSRTRGRSSGLATGLVQPPTGWRRRMRRHLADLNQAKLLWTRTASGGSRISLPENCRSAATFIHLETTKIIWAIGW